MKNYKKTKILLLAQLVISSFIFYSCEIVEPEEVKKPGYLKIQLKYNLGGAYNITEYDGILLQARDFKIFNDDNFADVFQHPKQILESSDSIKVFNMFLDAKNDSIIEVAHGAIAPLEYDSLYFQITPFLNFMAIDRRLYPITTSYENLPIENNFSKVVKIRDRIKISENKTTTLRLEFNVEENVFRVLDDFVFSAVVDTYYISND